MPNFANNGKLALRLSTPLFGTSTNVRGSAVLPVSESHHNSFKTHSQTFSILLQATSLKNSVYL